MSDAQDKVIVAFLLVNTEVGDEHRVMEGLKGLEEVTEAITVYGEYDVVCRLEVEDLLSLKRTLSEVRKKPFIKKTVTLVES